MTRSAPKSDAEKRSAKRRANRRYRERKAYADFLCLDCGLCTCCSKDYYMVHDAVWESACSHPTGMLCIGCLENRLGRYLTNRDFTDAPINALAVNSGSGALRSAWRRRPDDSLPPFVHVAPPAPPYCEHLPGRRAAHKPPA